MKYLKTKNMKWNNLYLVLLIMISTQVNAQNFSLSKNQITDSLYINGAFDDGVDLTNTSSNIVIIKYRVIENTIDTANWPVLYCSYPNCHEKIPSEEICDTIKKTQQVKISNFAIFPGANATKDCQLKIELFDMLDSAFRDTITYTFYGSSTDKALSIDSYSGAKEGKGVVKLFPNPASSTVQLNFNVDINSIRFIDLYGREVYSEIPNRSEIYVDVSEFDRGVYWVLTEDSEGKLYYSKLILE